MSTLLDLAQRIEATPLAVALAESRYAFPIVEGVHLIGLALSVGLIFLTDLRLIGVLFREVPVTDVLRHLRPYVLMGFAAVFASGALLFWAEASMLVENPAFPVKLLFIVLAGLNALYFEFVIAKRAPVRENHPVLPASVRRAGLASLVLWSIVIICGRLIPYMPVPAG
jgi:hypothetical protein